MFRMNNRATGIWNTAYSRRAALISLFVFALVVTMLPISIAFFLGSRSVPKKVVHAACAIVIILAILLSYSRGAFLGLIVVFLFHEYQKRAQVKADARAAATEAAQARTRSEELEQLMAFGRRFGQLTVHPFAPNEGKNAPELIKFRNDESTPPFGTDVWHSDETFRAMARLRGIGCNSPEGLAEAFYARKIVF